jgi:prepilin-type processing-associated H-X9-DG protein
LWANPRGNYIGCIGAGNMYGSNPRIFGNDPWSVNNGGNYRMGTGQPSALPQGTDNALVGVFCLNFQQSFDFPMDIPCSIPGSFTSPPQTSNVHYTTIGDIMDGTSNTIMFSEGLTSTADLWGGVQGVIEEMDVGGALFSTFTTPNSTTADIVVVCANGIRAGEQTGPLTYYTQAIAPCYSTHGSWTPNDPVNGPNPNRWSDYTEWYSAARSKHPGGVNVSFADGSVRFFQNTVSPITWAALGTMHNGEIVSPTD